MVAAALTTFFTAPASAQLQRVTVQLSDGTLEAVTVDLPPGTTLSGLQSGQVVPAEPLPGTPVSLEPIDEDPPPPPASDPPPPPASDPPPPPASDPPPVSDPPPPSDPPAQPPASDPPRSDPPSSGTPVTPPANGPATPAVGEHPGQLSPRRRTKRTHHTSETRAKNPPRRNQAPLRRPDGTPTLENPGFVDAVPGPSTSISVPNFIIRKFTVPIFLLPIYQAAGIEYGVRWEVLAAINEIETDYGRNLNVSTAGAVGWMQFLPSTWKTWGVDANGDGRKDPYNPVDAIFAAARYLKAAGAAQDIRGAVFAYNHAGWYVDSVLLRARLIAGFPADLVGSLTGLTEGRFPVDAHARYADDPAERNGALPGIDIFARSGAPVVAVQDAVIKRIGRSSSLGRYLVLQDAYGNRYTYARLGALALYYYPRPKRHPLDRQPELRPLKRGAELVAGTIIGRIGGGVRGKAPHLHFEIRPAGRGAPLIDPKPILDGWKLLEATAIYRAKERNVLRSDAPSLGQIFLMSKPALERRVLTDPRVDIYPAGRDDIRSGQINWRVLAVLEYLAERGLRPTVSSLKFGHSVFTASGNVSEHASGNAVDISAIDGIPVAGHQEPGGIVEQTVRTLMELQGALQPHQIISLLSLGGPTLALADHADHIHVGFRPFFGDNRLLGRQAAAVLEPDEWGDLMRHLRSLGNPAVPPQAP